MLTYKSNLNDVFVNSYLDKLKNTYPQMLRGNTVFTTLFKINDKTIFDEHSESVYETIGNDSPIRFTKIKSYPLFNVQQMDISIDWSTEDGLHPDTIQFQATVAPLVTQANVGDYLLLDYSNSPLLCKVLPNKTESYLDDNRYRTITLQVVKYKETDLSSQITSIKNYVFTTDSLISDTVVNNANLMADLYGSTVSTYIDLSFTARMVVNSIGTFNELESAHIRSSIDANYVSILADAYTVDIDKSLYKYYKDNDINSLLAFTASEYDSTEFSPQVAINHKTNSMPDLIAGVANLNKIYNFIKVDTYVRENAPITDIPAFKTYVDTTIGNTEYTTLNVESFIDNTFVGDGSEDLQFSDLKLNNDSTLYKSFFTMLYMEYVSEGLKLSDDGSDKLLVYTNTVKGSVEGESDGDNFDFIDALFITSLYKLLNEEVKFTINPSTLEVEKYS